MKFIHFPTTNKQVKNLLQTVLGFQTQVIRNF